MNPPQIFKYFSLISTPLFGLVSFLIVKSLPDFSFKKHTISKSVYFIKHKTTLSIFRLNFILKMILDLFFSWYLIDRLKILCNAPLFWLLILTPLLFGVLSYFVMGTYTLIHRILIFSYGILFGLSGILLSYQTNSLIFFCLTLLIVLISNFLIFEFFIKRKINVFIQIMSMSLMYGWLVLYVFRYL